MNSPTVVTANYFHWVISVKDLLLWQSIVAVHSTRCPLNVWDSWLELLGAFLKFLLDILETALFSWCDSVASNEVILLLLFVILFTLILVKQRFCLSWLGVVLWVIVQSWSSWCGSHLMILFLIIFILALVTIFTVFSHQHVIIPHHSIRVIAPLLLLIVVVIMLLDFFDSVSNLSVLFIHYLPEEPQLLLLTVFILAPVRFLMMLFIVWWHTTLIISILIILQLLRWLFLMSLSSLSSDAVVVKGRSRSVTLDVWRWWVLMVVVAHTVLSCRPLITSACTSQETIRVLMQLVSLIICLMIRAGRWNCNIPWLIELLLYCFLLLRQLLLLLVIIYILIDVYLLLLNLFLVLNICRLIFLHRVRDNNVGNWLWCSDYEFL